MNPGDLCIAQDWAPGYNFVRGTKHPNVSIQKIQHKQLYIFLGMDTEEQHMGRYLLPDGGVWLSDPMFMEVLQ